MCGICGEVSFNSDPPRTALIEAMCARMRSRGPDARGICSHNAVALGQRRLRIIDLSEHAAQPMVDSHLGLTIVFNGCIYNYPQLRQELGNMGYDFFSSGDTEVLLKAWHAWGPDMVHKLNGMFAFAVSERDTGRVVLVRDRLGIKPLYYARTGSSLCFASSLPALLEVPGLDTSLDPLALHNYMTFHSVVPAPLTLLRGVRKLPPASMLAVEPDGSTRETTYWALRAETPEDMAGLSGEGWRDLVLEALGDAVKRRLVADVDVGVLLSGGLDSSLVVGLLAREGQKGLNTFSIGFEAVGGEEGDEFRYSDVVAAEFDTRHHKIRVDADRALAELPACVAAMSEPMVSHDNIGFYLLSQEVSRHVKVVQSGQGADEIFAGYHWYPPMLQAEDPVAAYALAFFDRDHEEYMRAVHPDLHAPDDFSRRFVAARFADPGAPRAVDKALRLDTTVMLVDDPVKRVDNMTMAWGLEARVPFLDHELVELAAKVPAEHKLAQGGKGVLKEAARQVIPADVIDRPKGYFPVPALKYLRGPFLEMVQDLLSSQAAAGRGLFNPEYVQKLLQDPEGHITPLGGSKLWQVAVLEFWLQSHEI
jgi:asparagine synthase (glutamine-hydrolysing)